MGPPAFAVLLSGTKYKIYSFVIILFLGNVTRFCGKKIMLLCSVVDLGCFSPDPDPKIFSYTDPTSYVKRG
jgi:hypothetical protein